MKKKVNIQQIKNAFTDTAIVMERGIDDGSLKYFMHPEKITKQLSSQLSGLKKNIKSKSFSEIRDQLIDISVIVVFGVASIDTEETEV